MENKKVNIKFEEAIKRLEEIVEEMEGKDLQLEKSIKLFQEGMELAAFCNGKLEEAEKKVNVVMKNTQGKFTEEKFNPEEE
ncbi:MAG: xseB [Clostridiales bacterium]|jgi:exodeoxyribonuclease VII small subunit|nr:xseB [Clostridiales bacterium]